jgi:WD40 repeat protein
VTLSFDERAERLAGIDSDGMLHLWTMTTGKIQSKKTQLRGPVQLVQFSPNDNRLAIASLAGDLAILNLTGNEPTLLSQRHYPQVTAIAFSPDGRQLAVAHTKGQVELLDLTADASIALTGHTFAVWGVTFDERNQRLATASWDGTIKLWDRQTGELLFSQKGHEESVSVLRFGPQDQLLSASLDGSLKLWVSDVPARKARAIISGVSDSAWISTFSPDGKRLFVGGRNQRFEIWNMDPPQLTISQAGDGTTRCAAFSPDGSVLATGSDDRTVSLWDAPSGKRLQRMEGHPGAVSAVLFSLDGTTLISACDGGIVKLWDVASGNDRATLQGHHHQIYCAALSPNGKTLLTGGGNWTNDAPGELLVWELESGKLIRRLDADRLALWTIAYAPDGKTFATSSSAGTVNIRDASTLELKRSLPHSMWIRSMAFSPDGQSLAVGRGDGSVRIWDTTRWQERCSCDGHSSFTFFLQFSADGKTLVSAGNDGAVRFWDPRQFEPDK